VLAIAAVLILLALAPAQATADPVIAAAGDISCSSAATKNSCHQQATSDLLVGGGFSAVLGLGDIQYEKGALDAFQQYYDPTWGRVKEITRPAIGNHEYGTRGAAGYFGYFGAAAGPPKAFYSYDVGAWHLISLNSNCGIVSCAAGSPQETWLANDLRTHPASCTLAYWHHPRFSSGGHGDDRATGPLFADLYDAGAELVLVGHDHDYERFAPQTPDGKADPAFGVREFVVGTGGRSHYSFHGIKPNSQVRNDDTFGVLRLTLHPSSYDWRFIPEAGKTFTDAGTGGCHGAPGGPLLKLSKAGARLSRKGSVQVFALCSTVCTARARAAVRFGRGKVGSLRTRRTLSPERKVKLRLRFASGKARALRRALARGRRLRAKITVVATDSSGRTSTRRVRLRLRR
jgi:acid phosphatase type 7